MENEPENVIADPHEAIKNLGKLHQEHKELAKKKAESFQQLAALKGISMSKYGSKRRTDSTKSTHGAILGRPLLAKRMRKT